MSCCGCGCGGCGCYGCGCRCLPCGCPSNCCRCGGPILITTDCMAPLCPGWCCPTIDCIPRCPCGVNAVCHVG
ncbi:unnamed protein product [Allacma fusca]|uniref:Uncharacterized protein n=1 Tax=Allacma fusca TaxID=39272 RepID=A0A8J2KTU9_9HEXA|nr:unnamed protein product [Allacma fusca]